MKSNDINNNPWLALATYEEHDHHKFIGRDNDVENLTNLLRQNECIVCYAASGEGKSSLINAGLFPRLKIVNYFPIKISFTVEDEKQKKNSVIDFDELVFSKIEDYLESYNEEIDKRINEFEKEEEKVFLSKFKVKFEALSRYNDVELPDSLWWKLRTRTIHTYAGTTYTPVLIFDQFEEIFRTKWKKDFFKWLEILMKDKCPDENIDDNLITERKLFKVLFSMRHEYVGELDYWCSQRTYIPQMMRNRYFLKPLTTEQARSIILGQDYKNENIEKKFKDNADAIIDICKKRDGDANADEVSAIVLSLVGSVSYDEWSKNDSYSIQENSYKDAIYDYYKNKMEEAGISSDVRFKIEEALGCENRIKQRVSVNDQDLEDLEFNKKYKDSLVKSNIIRVHALGTEQYVEFTHDRLVEAIYDKHKVEKFQRRNKRLFRVSIIAFALLSIITFLFVNLKRNEKNYLITQAKFIAAEAEKLAEEGDVYNAAKLMTHIFRHNKYALKNVDCKGNVFKSVCEIASKQVHSKLLKGVTNAKYNEDGKYILAHSDSIVKLWSVNSMSVVWEKICNNKDEKITNVEFIPGGGYIAIEEYKKLKGIIELYSFGDDSCKLYKRFDNCNVVFSPDGKSALVRTVYPSDSFRLWSITNDKWIIDAPKEGNAGFSPLGKYVKSEITNCFSIYSAINGNTILSIDSVSNYCFSPDEKYILCGKRDNTIELWSIDSCKCTQTLKDIGYLSYSPISYSPNGNYVSISTKGSIKKLYSFKDGELKEVRTNFYSGKLKFDPKGELALVYSDSSAELRSLTNGSIIWSFGNTNGIDRAEFSNDGNYLLMYSRSSIILYSISDEKMILHNDICLGLSKARFSPRGKYVYTESLSQDIMYENIMSVNDGKVVCSHNITGYRNLMGTNVSFEPNDDCIIICDKSGCFMYELNENKLVSGYDNEIKNPFGNYKRIELAKITPDGKYLYAVSDERIAVWSFEKWEWLTKPEYIGDVKSIDFDVAGENMIVMKGNRAYLRSLKDPKREYTLGNISTNSVVFSNDGKYVLTASNDSTAKIWLVEDGNCIGTMKHGGIVNSAVFSNDGKHILTASNDRTAKLWSIDTIGKVGLEKTYIHDHVVDTAIFSLNDKYIATVSGGKHIETWTIDGKSLGRTRPLGENINCVSFDKYGNVMASYGDDSCAYKKIRGKKLYGRKDSIRFAKFTQDGNYLIRIKCNGNRYYDYLLSVMKVSKYKYVSCTAKYQVPYSNMLDVYYHKDGLYAIVKGKDSPNNEFMKIINISFIESVLNKWSETLGPDAELTKEEKAKYFLN